MLKALGGGKDDSANILNAVKKCNNGGHVVFPKGQQFTIGTALDLTFLNSIDLGLWAPNKLESITNNISRYSRNHSVHKRH